MCDLFLTEMGIDIDQPSFVIVGCDVVPGFDAIAMGMDLDFAQVASGRVTLARHVIAKSPEFSAILMVDAELTPFSDAFARRRASPSTIATRRAG